MRRDRARTQGESNILRAGAARREKNRGEKMKGKLRCIVAIVSILMLSAIVAPVFAIPSKPAYNLTGAWTFSDDGYMHTMVITAFNPCTGAFSGTGYYNPGSYVWTITGTESGNSITFLIVLTSIQGNGITLSGTGSLSSSTTMSGTGTQSGAGVVWSATKATLVVNVSWLVLNDEDYRWGAGCWALDSGLMCVQVWQLPDGSWVALKTYNEMFYTPQGAISPVAGTIESKTGVGTFNAQYIVSFTGTLATGVQLTGCLGVKNYGGTIADILLGTGAQGAPNGYSWRDQYFPSATNVIYRSDYWQYTLLCDKTAIASSLLETNAYQTSYYNPVIYPALLATPTAVGDIIT